MKVIIKIILMYCVLQSLQIVISENEVFAHEEKPDPILVCIA